MPIPESSATALIRFTGLGIILFNKEKQRAEIGIIRDDKHALTINIQKPVFQEGADGDVIVYQDIATYENLPKEDVQIEINAAEPAIAGFELYQPGDFDRLGAADPNDFRWIVNIDEDLHQEAPLAKATETDKFPLTKVYIGNGQFYTHRLDQNLFFEKVRKDSAGAAEAREEFGNVAETAGVLIAGAAVNVTIRIAGKEQAHSLPRVEGLPYIVKIVNMDYSANAVYSDMPDYYKYFASPEGVQFELTPVIEGGGDQRAKGGAINQDDFCHPITGAFPTIDEL